MARRPGRWWRGDGELARRGREARSGRASEAVARRRAAEDVEEAAGEGEGEGEGEVGWRRGGVRRWVAMDAREVFDSVAAAAADAAAPADLSDECFLHGHGCCCSWVLL
jgi:hypothetical protein